MTVKKPKKNKNKIAHNIQNQQKKTNMVQTHRKPKQDRHVLVPGVLPTVYL